jgi:hypothetical protein
MDEACGTCPGGGGQEDEVSFVDALVRCTSSSTVNCQLRGIVLRFVVSLGISELNNVGGCR